MVVKLSPDKLIVTMDKTQLKVGQTISYKPSDSEAIGIGKITELRHPKDADGPITSSVWMAVTDVVTGFTDWISCAVWCEQYHKGVFADAAPANTTAQNEKPVKQTKKEEPKNDSDNEPKNVPPTGAELW